MYERFSGMVRATGGLRHFRPRCYPSWHVMTPADGAPPDISTLIDRAERGDSRSAEALFASLYAELHRLSRRELARHAGFITISATTLLHEAYLDNAAREGTPRDARPHHRLRATATGPDARWPVRNHLARRRRPRTSSTIARSRSSATRSTSWRRWRRRWPRCWT